MRVPRHIKLTELERKLLEAVQQLEREKEALIQKRETLSPRKPKRATEAQCSPPSSRG